MNCDFVAATVCAVNTNDDGCVDTVACDFSQGSAAECVVDNTRVCALNTDSSACDGTTAGCTYTSVPPVPTYTLLGGANEELSEDQLTLTFDLDKDDLDEIKRIDGLLTFDANVVSGSGDSYIEYTSGFIKDMFGVDAEPVLVGASEAVRAYEKDATAAALVSFVVDMDTNDLILSFSEPIRSNTVNAAGKVTLSDPSSDSSESYVLNDLGTPSTTDQLTVTIRMTHADVGAIKVLYYLYQDQAHSAMSIAASFAEDMAGNGVQVATKSASDYRTDETAPKLTNFAVNLNGGGTIQLNFDEPMLASAFTVSPAPILTLQGGADTTDPSTTYETHVVRSMAWDQDADGPHLILTIDADELNEIKAKENLFSQESDTYISFSGLMAIDMSLNANQVEAYPAGAALRVAAGGFTDDSVKPELLSFELDMASEPGVLTMTFSETVDISSLQQSLISLQNAFNSLGNANNVVPLENSWVVNTDADSTEISITLHKTDFHQLKLKRVGISETTTYLVLGDGFVVDMAGKLSTALVDGITAKKVKTAGLVIDNVEPRIDVFDLNMNDGTVDIHFTEPVDKNSLNAAKFRLQGKRK